MTSLMTYFTLD